MEKYLELVQTVKEMRAAQQLYFRTRQAADLQAAKALEKKVDAAIASIEALEEKQTTLFS